MIVYSSLDTRRRMTVLDRVLVNTTFPGLVPKVDNMIYLLIFYNLTIYSELAIIYLPLIQV